VLLDERAHQGHGETMTVLGAGCWVLVPRARCLVLGDHFIALDTDLLDYFCLENEKDVVRLVGK
jgi:hypothetical protein